VGIVYPPVRFIQFIELRDALIKGFRNSKSFPAQYEDMDWQIDIVCLIQVAYCSI
jgi:hypothetical protein